MTAPDPVFRFREDVYLKELEEYIKGTYAAHYSGNDGIQAFELIAATGRAEGFTLGSIIKYAARFGRKEENKRKELLKIIHFAMLQLWVTDKVEGA